jgi:hypothetical protein
MSDAERERERLLAAWPDEFRDGVNCGYSRRFEGEREAGGYPRGFHGWSLDRRNSWFAGYNFGRNERLREATE